MLNLEGSNTRAGMTREDIIKKKKRSISGLLMERNIGFESTDLDDVIVEENSADIEKRTRKKYNNKVGFQLSDDQFNAIQGITGFVCSEYDENKFSATLCGYAGTGKGLVSTTPVLTSKGWKPIGSLSMDDKLFTPEGNMVGLMGIYHRGKQDIYKIKFSDGRSIKCDGDHLWTLTRESSFSTETSESIFVEETMTLDTRSIIDIYKHFKLYLPKIKPQCLVNTYGTIYYDLEKFKVEFSSPVENMSINKRFSFYYDVLSTFGCYVARTLNVECANSDVIDKFVTVARSLGESYKTWFCEESGMYNATMVNSVYIESIEPCGTDETVCIKVNSKKGLFIASDYIPTHNTTVTKLIYNNCLEKGLKVALCAPTHRAKYVMSNAIGAKADTLHSFLHLSPTLDIEKLSMDDLIFNMDMRSLKNMPTGGVVIVDECSMISDDMFDFLKRISYEFKCKVAFVGDSAQLRAVKSNDISKVFKLNNIYTLTTVHRQSNESALVPYLIECRNKPVREFNTKVSPNGSLYVMKDPKDFLRSYMRGIRESIENKQPDNTRILCYRNARVKEFNDIVRRCLYKNDYSTPYHEGDILMGYSNVEYDGYNFYNSSDYIICSEPKRVDIRINGAPHIVFPGWSLELIDFYNDQEVANVVVADMDNTLEGVKKDYAMFLEDLRLKAIKANPMNRRKLWDEWRKAFNSCAINDSLVYDNRVIKQKTFDYGYAISTHRSQGCTFNNAFVDLTDIFINRDEMELRQLEYVALSRTKTDCYVLSW